MFKSISIKKCSVFLEIILIFTMNFNVVYGIIGGERSTSKYYIINVNYHCFTITDGPADYFAVGTLISHTMILSAAIPALDYKYVTEMSLGRGFSTDQYSEKESFKLYFNDHVLYIKVSVTSLQRFDFLTAISVSNSKTIGDELDLITFGEDYSIVIVKVYVYRESARCSYLLEKRKFLCCELKGIGTFTNMDIGAPLIDPGNGKVFGVFIGIHPKTLPDDPRNIFWLQTVNSVSDQPEYITQFKSGLTKISKLFGKSTSSRTSQ